MHKAFVDTNIFLRLLVKDDETKAKACVNLIKDSKQNDFTLYVLPVTLLEIVWVLEKVYKYEKKAVRELTEAILNTPELKCEMEDVFRQALETYETRNVKFADAVMGYWGLERGVSTVFTYDENDFKRIKGLEVLKP